MLRKFVDLFLEGGGTGKDLTKTFINKLGFSPIVNLLEPEKIRVLWLENPEKGVFGFEAYDGLAELTIVVPTYKTSTGKVKKTAEEMAKIIEEALELSGQFVGLGGKASLGFSRFEIEKV